MIKVVIVDDDVSMVSGLEKMLDWENYGFQIIGKAYNGKEAFHLVEIMKPDLLITDISMPLMSGLELIEMSKQSHPSLVSLVLTCHEDFEMAREAIRLQTSGYLVKISLTKENLVEVLKKVKVEIEGYTEQERLNRHIERVIDEHRHSGVKQLLDKICYGFYSNEEDVTNDQRTHEKYLLFGPFRLIGVKILNISEENSFSENQEKSLMEFAIHNILEECMQVFENNYIYRYRENQYVVIVWDSQYVSRESERVSRALKLMKSSIKEHFKFNLSIARSNNYTHLFQLKNAIEELNSIHRNGFYSRSIIDYKKDQVYIRVPFEQKENLVDQFKKNLFMGEIEKIEVLVSSTGEEFAKSMYEPVEVREVFNQLLGVIEVKAIQDKTKSRVLFIKDEDLDGCIDKVKGAANTYLGIKHIREITSERKEISLIKEYIHYHLKEVISCDSMAEMVSMNPSYFSRLFKKEVGVSFTDYLNYVRISRAKQLLELEGMTIEEIVSEIGLQNNSCFYRLFKKKVGTTPGKYREKTLS